jgi:hypothetical protein
MKKFLTFIFSLFFLSQCGLPDASSLQALQFPALVTDTEYPKCTQNGPTLEITLKLMIYNAEIDFSGYDVYITSEYAGSIEQAQSALRGQVNIHITSTSLTSSWNEKVNNNFIINNAQNTYPTIRTQDLAPFPGYNEKPTYITYTLTHLPPEVNGGGTFTSGTQYAIGVTAISIPSTKESVLSNIIILDTGTPNGGRCGIIHTTLPLPIPSTRFYH